MQQGPPRQEQLRAALDELQAGRAAEAAALARPFAGSDEQASLLLGLALGLQGAVEAAAPLLARAATAWPERPHPVRGLADLLRRAGRRQEIAAHAMAALERRPDDPWVAVTVAEMLLDDGHHGAAAEQADDALAVRPDFLPALIARGAALAELGSLDQAIELFRRATEVAPGTAAGWSNLGKALSAFGQGEEAEAAFARAAALAPDDAQIGLNRAAALLRSGRYGPGWAALEARHLLPNRTAPPGPRLPAPYAAAGKHVLLWHEEGFGDTIQFIRYARPLAAAGAKVSAWVPRELRRLVASVEGVAEAVTERPVSYDWQAPMISLPGLFGADGIGGIPQPPYLRADAGLAQAWRGRLSHLHGLRVGLVWAGGARPWDPAATAVDRNRSATLDAFAPLGAVAGVSLVSLQAGPRGADAAPRGLLLHRPMQEGQDFAETAAMVANLDAIVAVDTAVAHLAGGMGKAVMMLNRWDGCWRWPYGQQDAGTPWYPSMRVLRQDRPRDWTGPMQRAADALAALVVSSASGSRLPA